MIPYGPEALSAYRKAQALVEEGRYEEARSVELQPSDRGLIEARIAAAKHVPGANTTERT